MTARRMPRIHAVVLPLLRAGLDAEVTSWVPDVGKRRYPLLNVRRLGGLPNQGNPDRLDKPVCEITAYTDTGLIDAEDLYLDARYLLWKAVREQTVTPAGYLHSFFETMGATPFDSPYEDTWRVQGLIQLGLCPPNN